ncbi:hypothetical protein LINPERHAP2_LOCUS35082 [Linum perenne]
MELNRRRRRHAPAVLIASQVPSTNSNHPATTPIVQTPPSTHVLLTLVSRSYGSGPYVSPRLEEDDAKRDEPRPQDPMILDPWHRSRRFPSLDFSLPPHLIAQVYIFIFILHLQYWLQLW